jgi:hypothetical protein
MAIVDRTTELSDEVLESVEKGPLSRRCTSSSTPSMRNCRRSAMSIRLCGKTWSMPPWTWPTGLSTRSTTSFARLCRVQASHSARQTKRKRRRAETD